MILIKEKITTIRSRLILLRTLHLFTRYIKKKNLNKYCEDKELIEENKCAYTKENFY